MAIVEAKWDLRPCVGAAIAPNHSNLRVAGSKKEEYIIVVDQQKHGQLKTSGRPLAIIQCRLSTDLHEPAHWWGQQVVQNKGVGADVCGHHQPAAVHLLAQRPDVYGQRGQVTTGRDQSVSQQDGAAEVQRDKATSSWDKSIGETRSSL